MAQLMLVNPRKRRKSPAKRRKTSVASRAVSSVKRRVSSLRKRYKRNPIGGGGANNAIEQFKTGAIGAAGALAVDVAMSKLPIPANLKTGTMAPIVKGLVGIGIGMAVAKFGKNRDLGKKLAQGAVTVSLYAAGREMLKAPLGLSDYSDELGADFDDLGYYTMGEYVDSSDGVGDLLNGYDSGMGDLLGAYDSGGAIVG